ncbi:MAG: enoyl-CoA hydratase/isomerase family protein [Pseudomonadota bacterium]
MNNVVEVQDTGHIRTIRLNRPEKKNAVNEALAWSLIGAIQEAGRDDNVWVIALTGNGDTFCAGLDLSGSEPASPLGPISQTMDDVGWVGRFLLTLREEVDKPIIGGINGAAVGAGLGLAMGCDIRIAAESARFMAGYTRIGGSPDGGLTFTLPQIIGYEKAMRFMLENRTVSGKEAVAEGLAGECVPDEQLADRLQEYCELLASWSPFSMRLTKRGMRRGASYGFDIESQVIWERTNIRIAFGTDDGKEARQAFLEKRKPEFKGR